MTIAQARAVSTRVFEPRYRWVILAVVVIAQIGATFPAQTVAVFGPFMQSDLGLSRAQLGLLQTALAVGQISLAVASGFATDRIGIRRMLLAGLVVMGVFIVSAGWGGSYSAMLGAFTIVGIGSAMVNPATVKAVMDWFLPRMRGTAMSVKQTGAPVGGMLAAVLLPSVALVFGWRAGLAGVGLGVIALAILCFILYRERGGATAGGGAASGGSLPSLLRLMRHREVLLISFSGSPGAAAQFAMVTFLILFLKDDLSYPVVLGGVMLSVVQFGGFGGRILWGLASDYLFHGNRRATLLTLYLLGALAMISFALLPQSAPTWLVAIVSAAGGLTVLSWNGVWMAQATELVDRESVGSVSGIAIMIGTLGVLTGAPVFGAVVDNTGSYRIAWLLMAAFCVISLLLLLALRSPSKAEVIGSR